MKILAVLVTAILMMSGYSPVHASSPSESAGSSTSQKRAELVQYSKDTDLKSLAKNGKTVVFFFATWCPNCVLTLTELSEKWSELDPSLTLVIADYDQEVALKSEYGVTYQDTFVLLTPEGEVKRRWNAGGVAGINKNIAEQ